MAKPSKEEVRAGLQAARENLKSAGGATKWLQTFVDAMEEDKNDPHR